MESARQHLRKHIEPNHFQDVDSCGVLFTYVGLGLGRFNVPLAYFQHTFVEILAELAFFRTSVVFLLDLCMFVQRVALYYVCRSVQRVPLTSLHTYLSKGYPSNVCMHTCTRVSFV